MQFSKYISFLLTVFFVSVSLFTQAQCAMCKGSVQTSQYAKSINNGIEYMLFAPIFLVAVIALIWIKNKDNFHTKEN
ncbi:MAG TPA: hypothetical protein PLX60_09215 [Chitinophagales bacterium]|jgi:hypothetical protein|nr:hypothetical protein [Chitinophagales bacterium]HOY42029.1 hypothetical protein [Chitinophagales bacterium]